MSSAALPARGVQFVNSYKNNCKTHPGGAADRAYAFGGKKDLLSGTVQFNRLFCSVKSAFFVKILFSDVFFFPPDKKCAIIILYFDFLTKERFH